MFLHAPSLRERPPRRTSRRGGATAPPAAIEPDRDLIARFAAGDGDAFRLLFEKHAPRVHAAALRILGDPHRAADVVQEVFVKVHERIPTFGFAGPFSLWLRTIAMREALNAARAARRALRRDLLAARPEEGDAPPDDEAERLLDALPDDLRATMLLRYFHRFTYAEIADALGVPVGTVRSRIFEAHRTIREGPVG